MVTSTRSNIQVPIYEAVLNGLSPDGGLYTFTRLNKSFYNSAFKELNYNELAFVILKELLDDFTDTEIMNVVNKSYNTTTFSPSPVTVKSFDKLSFLELYNGNTFAFKDLALSLLPNLYSQSKIKKNVTKKTVILTATSGDTGSAALQGFKHLDDVIVIVLYPTQGVSPFQEIQMNSLKSENAIVLAVDGNFDDCQNIVKKTFLNTKPNNITLSSANSINIGRIIPQIIYYFYTYYELLRNNKIQLNETVNVVVPTGNFGNIYAAYLAKSMGLPLGKLIIASNQNNVLTEVFNNGVYQSNKELHKTISPSMDILVSSNLERYLFDVYKQDHQKVNELMTTFSNTKEIKLDFKTDEFKAYFATEEETKETIKTTFDELGFLIDPHTAVAKHVYNQYLKETNDETHTIIASTANPYKFSDSILESLQLKKQETLRQDCETIETHTGFKVDSRIKALFDTKISKTEFKLEDTYKKLQELIGDLDDKN